MGEARRGRGRAVGLGSAGIVAAAVALTVLPSAGFGYPVRSGGAAQGPPKTLRLEKAHPFRGDLRNLPRSAPVSRIPPEREQPIPQASPGGQPAPVGSGVEPLAPAPAPTASFDGLDYTTWGDGHPPDTNGDVGPTYYIETVNTSIGVYRKSDHVRVAAFSFDTFMSQGSFGNLCDTNNFGDPVVLYDTFHDRWVITDFAFQVDALGNVVNPPGSYQCFAVSQSGDPVSGGWNFYSLHITDALQDYPKFGIWPDGLYMSANMFGFSAGGSFKNVRVWALNLAQMEAGASAPQVVSFDAAKRVGSATVFSMLPSNARLQAGTPPAGSPNYFVSTWLYSNALAIWKFHVDWSNTANSTFTGPSTSLAPSGWNVPPSTVPEHGGNNLDTLYIRPMMQNQYTNLSGAESLWDTHTVAGSSTSQAAVRWYQTNVTGGTIAANLTQASTFNPDSKHRFMPSLAVDRLGDMAIGYSVSSSTIHPAIRYAGRLASDPLNTLGQTETSLIEGAGSQSGNCGGSACTRWGDYSAMSLDPDGCTFWYTNEYYAATGLNWHTRIGSFKFASCTSADTTPPTASDESATTNQGTAVPITLQGSDPDSCELTFSIVAAPSNGSLGSLSDNACVSGSPDTDSASVTYTPNSGFSGADSLTYKVNDGTNDSNVATVSITVNAGGASYDQVVLADSPAAYWRLGESSGTSAADASGHGNTGSYQNGPTLGQPGLISGGDTSVSFDGADDRVLVPDSASLSPTGAVSVEAWVRATSLASSSGGYRTIALKGASYWLRIDNVGGVQRARFYIRDAGTYYGVTAAGVALTAGTTYHLVGTYNGSTLRIYINGVQQGSATHTGATDDTTAALQISSLGSVAWNGRLDEIAIYPNALSATRIQQHYTQGLAG